MDNDGQPVSLEQAACDAWIYGVPLIESAALRSRLLSTPLAAVNKIMHRRRLSTWEDRYLTTPNNDTLYSNAWVNLDAGPVILTLPKTARRYISVALLDMYTNVFAILGTRTVGGDGGRFTILGPSSQSGDRSIIRSPTSWVWLFMRVLVEGEADVRAAQLVQDSVSLAGPSARPPDPSALRSASWQDYFKSMQALMIESPPPVTDTRLLRDISALGISITGGFDPARFNIDQVRRIEVGVATAKELTNVGLSANQVVGEWAFAKADLGLYGQNYLYRAQIALAGLGALPRVEVIYAFAIGPRGSKELRADMDWLVSFAADKMPPVKAFWSITMYEATADGQYFFAKNPVNRYSIGDRTPGLQRNREGGLDIWVSRNRPSTTDLVNWLPAPATPTFGLAFRGYLPRGALLDGDYLLPNLIPA